MRFVMAIVALVAITYLVATRPAGAALNPTAPVEEMEPQLVSLKEPEFTRAILQWQMWLLYEEYIRSLIMEGVTETIEGIRRGFDLNGR